MQRAKYNWKRKKAPLAITIHRKCSIFFRVFKMKNNAKIETIAFSIKANNQPLMTTISSITCCPMKFLYFKIRQATKNKLHKKVTFERKWKIFIKMQNKNH